MSRRSNRFLKYRARHVSNELAISGESRLTSSNAYKFQVCIVYATGLMDVMCSIVLFSCCAEVLKILKFTSDFQTAFPNYSKEQYKQIIAVVMETFGKTLDDVPSEIMDNLDDMLPQRLMFTKVVFVLLSGVALYFSILSVLLFVGIQKKNYVCCHIWNVCWSITMTVYVMLAFVVLTFQLFQTTENEVGLVVVYALYRIITITAVYRFQQKYLFISQNGQGLMDPHRDLHYLD